LLLWADRIGTAEPTPEAWRIALDHVEWCLIEAKPLGDIGVWLRWPWPTPTPAEAVKAIAHAWMSLGKKGAAAAR
jgi:hypothetical protein